MVGKRRVNLAYTEDQLNFSRFHVWYKYKAASHQLLDSWEDKRMTGLRLSWRIKNDNPPLIANISELGRSIQTPGLGDVFLENLDGKTDARIIQ